MELTCCYPRCEEDAATVRAGFALCNYHNTAEFIALVAARLDSELWADEIEEETFT